LILQNEDELDRVRDSVDYNSRSKNILTDALQKSKSINESSQSLMQSSRGSEGRRSIVGPTLPPGVLPNVLSQARGLEGKISINIILSYLNSVP